MSKRIKFQTPKGMRDILPKDQAYWLMVRNAFEIYSKEFGFDRIDTPILEDEALFIKGTGEQTDIVEKEMFTLTTKGRDRLTLRPEFTPAVMRAYLENGFTRKPSPVKLFSIGPIFRYERPQKGRWRQAHQANFEIIGEQDPIFDAQLIQLFFFISKKLGLKKIITQINSIGCGECRPDYRRSLTSFLRSRKAGLCDDCQKRLQKNPLRILDCKQQKCKTIVEEVPQILDFLCSACHNHFKGVLEYLDELDIPYLLDSRLVQGLDYYTKTVFEIGIEGSPSGVLGVNSRPSLAGGGRYDSLIKLLGGRDKPSVGFAAGLDRIVDLMKEQDVKMPPKSKSIIFLIQLGDLGKKKSLKLFESLIEAGLEVASSPSRRGITAQLKLANKLKARFALILGQKEALDESIIIRDMNTGDQKTIPINKMISELKKRVREIEKK